VRVDLRQWIVLLRAGAGVSGLDVGLVPKRSHLRRATLRRLESPNTYPASLTGRVAAFELREEDVGELFVGVLEVEYFGDAPQVAEIAWRTSGDATPVSYLVDVAPLIELGLVSPSEAKLEHLRVVWGLALRLFGEPVGGKTRDAAEFATSFNQRASQAYRHRREVQEKDERARRFFLALDLATLGPDLDEEWRTLVADLNEYLTWRVEVRASVGGTDVPVWESSERMTQRLRVMSSFLRGLMAVHLDESVAPGVTEWAFVRFATDSLAVTHWDEEKHDLLLSHGAPDSELFFNFAELALACLDDGIDAPHWERSLPALARAAHVYAEHGAEKNGDGRYVYAYREDRRFPLARIREIDEHYQLPAAVSAKEFFEDRFTSLVAQALPVAKAAPSSQRARGVRHRARFVRQVTRTPSAHAFEKLLASMKLFDAPLVL
jgi:hypothetical protein